MKKRFNYYAAVGSNGATVVDSWGALQRGKAYLENVRFKGFDSFEEAEKWALAQLSQEVFICWKLPTELRLNFMTCFGHRC